MKEELILEEGAMRGLFSASVMGVLMENNIWPDGVISVSAGATFGCNMESKQAGRVLRYNQKLTNDWRCASLRSLLTAGDYYDGGYVYHYMPRHTDYSDVDTLHENSMEFWAVCTNVGTGKAKYKRLMEADNNCLEHTRASASMPITARIVTVEDEELLDGGVADLIPLRSFQEQGYKCNLVIFTQLGGFVKEPNSLMPLMCMWLHCHPYVMKALEQRHIMYNEQSAYIHEEEKEPNTLVLHPKAKLTIGHLSHDPVVVQIAYYQGREVVLKHLNEVKGSLGVNEIK